VKANEWATTLFWLPWWSHGKWLTGTSFWNPRKGFCLCYRTMMYSVQLIIHKTEKLHLPLNGPTWLDLTLQLLSKNCPWLIFCLDVQCFYLLYSHFLLEHPCVQYATSILTYAPISGLHTTLIYLSNLSSIKICQTQSISISLKKDQITLRLSHLSVPEACCRIRAMTRATKASKWMITLALSVHRPSKMTAWRITCGLTGSATAPPRLFPCPYFRNSLTK
jgi:hypothetical protein